VAAQAQYNTFTSRASVSW